MTKSLKDTEFRSCPICLDDINVKNNYCITPCGHEFCFKCLMKSISNNNQCPCCRAELQEPYTDYRGRDNIPVVAQSSPSLSGEVNSNVRNDLDARLDAWLAINRFNALPEYISPTIDTTSYDGELMFDSRGGVVFDTEYDSDSDSDSDEVFISNLRKKSYMANHPTSTANRP